MKVRIAALFAAAIVCASPARGQQAGSPLKKLEIRKWDFGGSLGILGASKTSYGGTEVAGTGGYNSSDQWTWAANIDAGRYFTTHLKADVGLMWSSERSSSNRSWRRRRRDCHLCSDGRGLGEDQLHRYSQPLSQLIRNSCAAHCRIPARVKECRESTPDYEDLPWTGSIRMNASGPAEV